jgi:hypothetical protein
MLMAGSVAFVILVLQYGASLLASGVAFLLLGSIALFGLVLVTFGLLRRQPVVLIQGICCLALMYLALWTTRDLVLRSLRMTEQRGDQIALALEAHRKLDGSYPSALEQLVPARMSAIPDTAIGLWSRQPFHYMPADDRQSFVLRFASPAWVLCERSSGRSEWRCHD